MNTIYKVTDQIQSGVDKFVTPVLSNPQVQLITGWIILYIVIDSFEKTPTKFKEIIKHDITKCIFVFIASYYATGGQIINTVLLTVGIIVLYILIVKFFPENFEIVKLTPNIYPGCVDIKASDLTDLYKDDIKALSQDMYNAGVPVNLKLTDFNAPLIATYLVNRGTKDIGGSCTQPK